jgi:hypothetical protein
MSHALKADKLLIKPAAGARPAPPHTRRRIIRKARTRRPVTRRVTRGTATTRLAMSPDRPTSRLLQPPERGSGPSRHVESSSMPEGDIVDGALRQDDPDSVRREYADEMGLSARIALWARRPGPQP